MVSVGRESKVEAEVASALKRHGVRYLFGIPGGGTSIDLMEACRKEGIPFVLAQHETSAGMMAIVCGELTGSTGVCVSIMGPGAIALAGAAGYAYWERHSLLCLTERYASAQSPLMSLQRMDHSRMFSAFSKGSVTLGPTDPGGQIEEAARLAHSERPGPVHVDFPMDLGPVSDPDRGGRRTDSDAQTEVAGDLDAIADAINQAERPVLIAGPAVRRQNAGQALLRLVEKLQIAIMVTSKARGVIDESHPLFAGVVTGVYGENTFEGRIARHSDLIVAVGLDRMELLAPWRYPQPLVTLDAIDVPEEETVGRPSLTASGPLPDLLDALESGLHPRKTWDVSFVKDFWDDAMTRLGATEGSLNTASLLALAREIAPSDTILATETGIYNAVNLFVWKVYEPSTYFGSSGSNTMGFTLPAALAAALTRPAQKTVGLVGDGGFLMRAPELEVAARMKLSPVLIVFNDGTLGLIRVKQQAKKYAREGVDLAPVDFVRLAESFGGLGWQVRTLEEFEAAFKRALSSDRLAVIDARLDPDAYAGHLRHIRG
jgi:acetolactate synthase-1/2/3 large subunit